MAWRMMEAVWESFTSRATPELYLSSLLHRSREAVMLELRNVTKQFTGAVAVDGVTFSARAGEITGYLGPNGSGKSTTMKMLAGLMQPTSGTILFNGQPVAADLNRHKERMGYVPEEPHLYGHLSGLEYLIMVGQLRNLP